MRGATRDGNRLLTALRISIHAPHARSDLNSFSLPQSHWQNFNPRSSCEERRHLAAIRLELIVFQSTLLMRGATATLLVAALALAKFQSTLLMRGATLRQHLRRQENHISIHAPHARSDRCGGDCIDMQRLISIHAPHARSDLAAMQSCHPDWISIHAPHARSDVKGQGYHQLVEYFNPRSSCEERPLSGIVACFVVTFQSTLLMRGATAPYCTSNQACQISIHAPHARSDQRGLMMSCRPSDFNPRSSCEERRPCTCQSIQQYFISIHAPHARSDLSRASCMSPTSYFNPRSSCEERRWRSCSGSANP